MEELSKREREIVHTIIAKRCFTAKKIAKELNISRCTVASHLLQIYMKLYLPQNNIAGLVWYYYQRASE